MGSMDNLTGHQKIIQDYILAEVLSWKGTPYRNGCKQKGRGVDCAQLIAIPFKCAGIIPKNKIVPPAGGTAVMDSSIDPNKFHDFIVRYAIAIPFDDRRGGDIVTFYNCGIEHHVCMIIDGENMIDATLASGAGRVRVRRVMKLKNLCAVYRPFCLLDLSDDTDDDVARKRDAQLDEAMTHISKNNALEWKS